MRKNFLENRCLLFNPTVFQLLLNEPTPMLIDTELKVHIKLVFHIGDNTEVAIVKRLEGKQARQKTLPEFGDTPRNIGEINSIGIAGFQLFQKRMPFGVIKGVSTSLALPSRVNSA